MTSLASVEAAYKMPSYIANFRNAQKYCLVHNLKKNIGFLVLSWKDVSSIGKYLTPTAGKPCFFYSYVQMYYGLAPLYLQKLIQECKPTRNLRSLSKLNLVSTTVTSQLLHIMITAQSQFVKLPLNYGTILPCMSKIVELYANLSLLSRHTYSKLFLMIKFSCC